MRNEAPFQINLKTPGGTLLNIRAWTEQELHIYIDALQLRIPDIQTLWKSSSITSSKLNA